MRCCDAWKPVGKCFDPISLECIDFQRLSQIIANLTRENLAEREAEIRNLLWTQTEKDNALAKCRLGQQQQLLHLQLLQQLSLQLQQRPQLLRLLLRLLPMH